MRADLKPERFSELLKKGPTWIEFGCLGHTFTAQGFSKKEDKCFVIKSGNDSISYFLEDWEVERLIQFLQQHLENGKL
jgi:hypothetical protein